MGLAFKHGVKLFGMRPELGAALTVVEGVFRDAGYPATVTSVTDGSHSNASLHYTGCALDLRTRDIPQGELEILKTTMRDRLTIEFDVVLEKDHFHIEYQPKTPVGVTS